MRARLAIALICIALLAVFVPALAQPPDCTTKECRYLPLIKTSGLDEETATTTIEQPTSTPSPTATKVPIVGIVNGDFEQDDFGWTGTPLNAVDFITSSPQSGVKAQSGFYVAQIGYAETEEIHIEQEVTVPANAPYLVYSIWVTSTEPTCGDDLGGMSVYPPASAFIPDPVELCAANETSGWVRRSIDLRDHIGELVMILVAGESQIGDDLSDSAFAVDDITFSAVP